MTPHTRLAALTCAMVCALASPAAAQGAVGAALPGAEPRPGWTLTPRFAFTSTYDDNITLFGQGSAEEQNDDYISSYAPELDLSFRGRRTRLSAGYSGSFLNYQTFSIFDRWQQRGSVDVRRDESQRLQWFGHASAAKSPSTETVDLGGIPFSHTGATMIESRAGVVYRFDMRDSISTSVQYQDVEFERPNEVREFLRGGHVMSLSSGYRRALNERIGIGVNYAFRQSFVSQDTEEFNIHSTHAAFDYDMSAAWSLRGGAGVTYLAATGSTPPQTGPSFQGSALWRGRTSTLQILYDRSFMASFGFGGTVRSQDVAVSYRAALFRSRRFYTDQSLIFRDSTPLIEQSGTLALRSLRTNSVLGWTPESWVRLELFYSRTQQTSLRPGGRLDRNRVGFQIVTTKPMRMQ
jgi:hypothetical protein